MRRQPRSPVRRSPRGARRARPRDCAGRALRPGRPRRVRARVPRAPRRGARRGRRPGGFLGVWRTAARLRRRAREGEHVDPDARPPPRRRPRPSGGAAPCRAARRDARVATTESAEDAAWLGFERERVQEALAAAAATCSARRSSSRTTAASRSPSSSERLGSTARYDQEQDVRRARAVARASARRSRGRVMENSIHELTAGYALDALDPAERDAFEAHLDGLRAVPGGARVVLGGHRRPGGRRRRPCPEPRTPGADPRGRQGRGAERRSARLAAARSRPSSRQ